MTNSKIKSTYYPATQFKNLVKNTISDYLVWCSPDLDPQEESSIDAYLENLDEKEANS